MQAQWQREHPTFLPIETNPLPADLLPIETDLLPACLRTAPRVELERPTSFVWVFVGVALFFGSVIAGGYWLIQRWQPPAETVEASPPAGPAKPVSAAALPRAAAPAPPLSVGLPALSGQTTTGSAAAQSPVPAPGQPPPLAVALRPIIGQPPAEAPAPQPAAEAPPPAEPLPSPAPSPKPHRKAAAHRSSPVVNPSQSSGFVKF
jgi:hypothetical protein